MTPLLSRLERWAKSLVAGEDGVPRAVILVGGPGNGKTEAIEFAVDVLDAELGPGSTLRRLLGLQFLDQGDQPPPRLARVDVGQTCEARLPWTLGIVQDASAPDPADAKASPAELLVRELDEVLSRGPQFVYLACVNRGVLDDALTIATDRGQSTVAKLIQEMVRSVGQSLSAIPCWPLLGFPKIAAWPMDVESLLEGDDSNDPSAALQVLRVATDKARWPLLGQCVAGDLCPYCSSRDLLSGEPHEKSLLQILRWYELASGKRWSFRDLFSLVSFLLAGASARTGNGRNRTPCEHAAHLLQVASGHAKASPARKHAAPYVLAAAQYQHALFGAWSPRGLRGFWDDLKDLRLQSDGVLAGLYHFLARPVEQAIPHTLAVQLVGIVEALDPAMADPDSDVRLSKSTTIPFREIDIRFSESTREGLLYVKKYQCLTTLDVNLLGRLAEADDQIPKCEMARRHPEAASRVQGWIRDFACRYTRRAVGVRSAATREAATLAAFERVAAGDRVLLHEAVKQVDRLLNENGRFEVSLNTTFGEPAPPTDRRAVLVTTRQKVKARERPTSNRPAQPIWFLEAGASRNASHSIALTFDLYRAVRELQLGMQPASLPRAVLALLDATRARLAGSIVRNEELLEDSQIRIGRRNERIVRELDQFLVQRS